MCVYTIHVTTRLSDDDTKNGGGGGGEEEEEEDRHAHVINPRAAKRRRRRVDLTDVKDHIKSAASAVAVALISCYSFTRCFTISSCRSSFLFLFSEKRRDLVEDEEEEEEEEGRQGHRDQRPEQGGPRPQGGRAEDDPGSSPTPTDARRMIRGHPA